MVFEFITGYHFENVDIAVFFTLILLEGVLSFDNAAILAAMVRKLPEGQRRKALLYGLGGAYFFRATAILLVSFIIANAWLKILGGMYLLYLCIKHLLDRTPHDLEEVPGIANKRLFGLSAFWSIVVAVELADIAFALDQVLVAVALTPKVLLIILASFVAILFLRLSAYYVGRLMDWFPQLETLAYVAVGWVGIKLILTTGGHYLHVTWFEFLENKWISVSVTLTVIVLPVLIKAFRDFVLHKRHAA